MNANQVVGKPLVKKDAAAKVTGRAIYADDIFLKGMLHVKVLRSPHAHAVIKNIDTSEAEKLPGVKYVMTHKNAPDFLYNSYWREPVDSTRLPDDEQVFSQKMRYYGDRVAAVVAISEEVASDALKLIKVDYEVLPAINTPLDALKPSAVKIHDSGNLIKEVRWDVGDVDKGFAEADYIFEENFQTSVQQHVPLEPRCYIADYDPTSEKLTVWSSTQGVHNIRVLLGKLLKMPLSKIEVLQPFVGGGFGGKNDLFEEILVSLLSMRVGKPVKINFTREEEFVASRVRHAHTMNLKMGVKKDGTLIARHLTAFLNSGGYAAASSKVALTTGHRWIMLYRTPNIRYEGSAAYTNYPVAAAMRGFGTPQQTFATEILIDRIARKLNLDVLEFHKKNLVRVGDYDPISNITIESCGLEECIDVGAKEIGWYEKRGKKIRSGSKVRGVGMAVGTHNTGVKPFVNEISAAFVKLNEDGSLNVMAGSCDIGQGSDTMIAQIAAETLGIPYEKVEVLSGNTDVCPYDIGTHSSRQTYMAGNAVHLAALEAKKLLLENTAINLGTSPDDLEIREGVISSKSEPQKSITVGEAAMTILHQDKNVQIMGRGSFASTTNAPPFMAHFAEVEVDTETGEVNVLKLVAVSDCGTAINPLIVKGQAEGGLIQGLGFALMEGLLFDSKTGVPLNANMTDYFIPTAMDVPDEVKTFVANVVEPTGPYGAKGIGEPAMVATAPAILNAITDATGVELNNIPITAEKMLSSLRGN